MPECILHFPRLRAIRCALLRLQSAPRRGLLELFAPSYAKKYLLVDSKGGGSPCAQSPCVHRRSSETQARNKAQPSMEDCNDAARSRPYANNRVKTKIVFAAEVFVESARALARPRKFSPKSFPEWRRTQNSPPREKLPRRDSVSLFAPNIR